MTGEPSPAVKVGRSAAVDDRELARHLPALRVRRGIASVHRPILDRTVREALSRIEQMFTLDVRCRPLAPKWMPLSRTSGPAGVPHASAGHRLARAGAGAGGGAAPRELPRDRPGPGPRRPVIDTGFAALDAILGPGGLPIGQRRDPWRRVERPDDARPGLAAEAQGVARSSPGWISRAASIPSRRSPAVSSSSGSS